jgi:hypothetical protein
LGLAIVKKIMEDHGGQVILDDRPDGPGTVATLVLPSAPEPAQGSAGEGSAGETAGELAHAGTAARSNGISHGA